METLRATIIQAELHWEQPEQNRKMFSEKIGSLDEETDLIVLPEMFSTGFSMNANILAEEENGPTLNWMREEAGKCDAAICGSVIVKDNDQYFNRLLFVLPDGSYQVYDKRHTFTLAGEHKTYSAGEERVSIDYKGWKVRPLICYDLRFPVWSRNTDNYELLIYVANWPRKRVAAWDALLKARAIENMSYCIGVNRVGLDGNGHEYTGHTAVYDALGELISREKFEGNFTQTVSLSKTHLETTRRHLMFLRDRDDFNLV